MDSPFGLLAELTYGCPLHCPYCSNPLDLGAYAEELTTAEWQRVLAEARDLGVLQLHLSGGEPLLRRDLDRDRAHRPRPGPVHEPHHERARPLARRAGQLRDAGLDHVQISVQADEPALSDRIAGLPSFERKLAAARLVKKLGWPLTLNVVLHRGNIDRIGAHPRPGRGPGGRPRRAGQHAVLRLGAAQPGRAPAEPGPARARRGRGARGARAACGNGWRSSTSCPTTTAGTPSPAWAAGAGGSSPWCPTATSCRARPPTPCRCRGPACASIPWRGSGQRSPLFQRFRGTDWMPEPCRSCDRRELDFGGCRCQAFQLTGDAARTDPVCHLSPDHAIVSAAVRAASEAAPPREPVLVPRPHPQGDRPAELAHQVRPR